MAQNNLIRTLIERICVPEFCVGSPAYGVLKYQLPECDLTLLKQQHVLPAGEKMHKFGLKLKCGATWQSYDLELPECLVRLQRLDSFGVHTGQFVYKQRVEFGRVRDKLIPDQIDWMGDLSQLQEVVYYLDLMQ